MIRRRQDPAFAIARVDGVHWSIGWYNAYTGASLLQFDGPIASDRHRDFAYVALRDTQILGVFNCFMAIGGTFYAHGTLVRPAYRQMGIARALWERALQDHEPKQVVVSTVTDRGYTLIKALQKAHPRIKWTVQPNRKRVLKKGKGRAA